MTEVAWGLLGPEKLESQRRTRTLGLGAAVRAFNDLAVPGMGNVFFGKQLLLATLGIALAQRLRGTGRSARNIEAANAVEALACWLAFESNGWQSDARLRGGRKMRGKSDLSYAAVRRSSFYVTQPMRMGTVQPLLTLGLVESESERFNAYRVAQTGHSFLDAVCDALGASYHTQNVYEHLFGWATGNDGGIRSSATLRSAISPVEPLPPISRQALRGALIRGDTEGAVRRRAILSWVDTLWREEPKQIPWSAKPEVLRESHWKDLHAGELFFVARDAALSLLDNIEAHIGNLEDKRLELITPLPPQFSEIAKLLKERANAFLEMNHDPTPGGQARTFCRECLDEEHVVEKLVRRDDHILRWSAHNVVPGPAFRGASNTVGAEESGLEDDDTQVQAPTESSLPAGISQRVHNMFLFNIDMQGKLTEWLGDVQ
jgi:hypothetical protein